MLERALLASVDFVACLLWALACGFYVHGMWFYVVFDILWLSCLGQEKKLVEEVFNNAIDCLSDEDKTLPQVRMVSLLSILHGCKRYKYKLI